MYIFIDKKWLLYHFLMKPAVVCQAISNLLDTTPFIEGNTKEMGNPSDLTTMKKWTTRKNKEAGLVPPV